MRGILCAAAVALLLSACTAHADDAPASVASAEAPPTSAAPATNDAVGFPELPPRGAVPIDLNEVQGFVLGGDHEQQVRSVVLEVWREWAIGSAVQECMVSHGYDWELELPGGAITTGVASTMEHFDRPGDWDSVWMINLAMGQASANDEMLAALGEARTQEALGVLYGDLSAYYDYSLEYLSQVLDDPEYGARAAVEQMLTLPRGTGQVGDGGILEYAGGCVGQARESVPDFVAIPPDIFEAFSATYIVDEDDPLMVQAREAFDQCIDDVGVGFAVDPAQMEVLDGLDADVVDAAYSECQTPYRNVVARLQELARDQFVRDYEPFLTARNESYEELYASLDGDAAFQSFVDLLETQAASVG